MKNKIIKLTIFSLILINEASAFNFEAPVLLARSNVSESFNLPPQTYLNNVAPVINNSGDVAFKVIASGEEGLQGIWVKAHNDSAGKILIDAPEDYVITDPSINDSGKITYSLFDEVSSLGVYTYDIFSFKNEHVIDAAKEEIKFFTYPSIINNNVIYFRGTDKFDDRAIYSKDNKLVTLFSEGTDVLDNSGSYIFKPSINQSGRMAFKLRLGKKGDWDESRSDVIALFDPNYSDEKNKTHIKFLATDKDYDQRSPYLSFLNSVSLSNAGHVAFAAVIEDHRIGAFLIMPTGETKRIALENEDDVLNIETFSIRVNALGHVLFRGKDKEGKRAIFFQNGDKLQKLIRESDEVNTDLGIGKILDNQYYPGFSGEVDLNDVDQIVFGAVIQNSKDNHEWGQGIFLINPVK
jgi:hypothetical protein